MNDTRTFIPTLEAQQLTGMGYHSLRRRYLDGLVESIVDPRNRRRRLWNRADLEALDPNVTGGDYALTD